MAKKISELSVFFPFWNEEENIVSVVEQAISIAKKSASKYEIVMVDDGSSDSTFEKAESLSKKYPNLRVISHSPNRGYGAALKSGFESAKYKYVVFTDGDGQFDFAEVTKFIDKIESCDIVIGYRKKRKDQFVRHLLMYMLKVWDFIFFRFYYKDID